MQDSVEGIVFAVGGAFVSPNLGTAELIVALLVALAFALSAVQTFAKGRDGENTWRDGETWHDGRTGRGSSVG